MYEETSKVRKILEIVENEIYNTKTHSVVIFSQFTSFLKIVEMCIKDYLGYMVYNINGAMSKKKRDESLESFNSSRVSRVMLVSLQAGGTGISMHHGCSTVIMCEPYWNPFIEMQAQDRVHRLGQDEQVKIYRLSVDNSIETWIETLKKKKYNEASMLSMTKTHKSEIDKLDFAEELRLLFKQHVSFKKDE